MSETLLDYPFTQEELDSAAKEWGCNCGPSALAFALQLPLEKVRHAIPEFEAKRYTSPTMMSAALKTLGRRVYKVPVTRASGRHSMYHGRPSLVRIQFAGPWTEPGANPKWAYWHTHWVCTFVYNNVSIVFDCNTGCLQHGQWCQTIVPMVKQENPRFSGDWWATHVWTVQP